MEFTTREIASGIIFIGLILLAVIVTKDRAPLRRAIVNLLSALVKWKVWTVLVAYFAFVTGMVMVAHNLGFWSASLFKETIIIGFFTGLPFLFNSTDFKNGSEMVRYVAKDVLGVAALIVVYVNLATFPLWGELLLQICLLLLLLLTLVAKSNPKTARVGKLFETLTSFIVLGLIVYVSVQLAASFGEVNWEHEVATFALSVWLPISIIPFIYLFAFVAACESTLVRAKFHNGRAKLPARIRLAFLLGVRGRLSYATSFRGHWLSELASNRSFRGARRTMRKFRSAVRSNARRNHEHRRRLKQNAGAKGVDSQGLWRDRREFGETKEALKQVFESQRALYRHHGGRYCANPILIFPPSGFNNLPENHGINYRVREDGQAWLAWRVTSGGFYLGVGGTSDVDAQWRYAGTEKPSAYPTPNSTEWSEVSGGTQVSPEWHFDDGLPEPI